LLIARGKEQIVLDEGHLLEGDAQFVECLLLGSALLYGLVDEAHLLVDLDQA